MDYFEGRELNPYFKEKGRGQVLFHALGKLSDLLGCERGSIVFG